MLPIMEVFEHHISKGIHVIRQTGDSLDLSLEIPRTFPYLEGHFPNQPILPASIALELSAWLATKFFLEGEAITILRVSRSKFNRNISPMEQLQINLTVSKSGTFRSRWLAADGTVAIDLRFTLG